MIETIQEGDVFSSTAQVIVVTVNLVGVMGKGIALTAKQQYPGIMRNYKARCDSGELQVGKLLLYPINDGRSLLLFPTKQHWRKDSRIEWIEAGLKKLATTYKTKGIKSIALPPLGCGNGNLLWEDVYALILRYLGPTDLEVHIYL